VIASAVLAAANQLQSRMYRRWLHWWTASENPVAVSSNATAAKARRPTGPCSV